MDEVGFGRYRLVELLGRGGMGEVWRAYDSDTDRVVAIKLVPAHLSADEDFQRRFRREAHAAAGLNSPHAIPIHHYGEIDGRLYVDMRLIQGRDLQEVLSGGPLELGRAVRIIEQVARALHAAHQVGLVHRDVKPSNILLDADDYAYLIDFGIARAAGETGLTGTGGVIGSWPYMAPERFSAQEADARADVYALACVLYECLTGDTPYPGDSLEQQYAGHVATPPPRPSSTNPDLPTDFDRVTDKGLAKDPDQRYQTATELANAAHEAITEAPAPKKRYRWVLAAATVVLVVALAAGFGIWQLTSGKSPQKNDIDISKLDVGNYGTKSRPLTGDATKEEGKYLEAYRLAEGIVDPYDVDPVLDHLYGYPLPDPQSAAASISGTGTPLVQPVLEKYGMISAYLVNGLSKMETKFERERNGELLSVMLTSFPSDDAAARAATEMDAVDFAVNPENLEVSIPGYPKAKAHYRPDYPSIGSTMASGSIVASVYASSGYSLHLRQRVIRTFDLQGPLVANLLPTFDAELTTLPRDPDHMLSRLLVAGDQPKISRSFGSMGPRAALLCTTAGDLREGLFEQLGIDRCAQSNDAELLRAKDETAAKTGVPKMVETQRSEHIDHDVAPPDGLKDARCFEEKQEIVADNANARFECYVSFGRYIAEVWSNEEKDVRQRAAAQYAILVNSG